MADSQMTGKVDLTNVRDIRELDKIRIVDERGYTQFIFGFWLNMFFLNGHLAEKRLRGIDVLESYRKLFVKEITHYLPNGSARLKKIDDGAFIHYREEAQVKETHDYGFAASLYGFPNGKPSDDPTSYCAVFIALSENPFNPWYSRFDLYFPISWVVDQGYSNFAETVRNWSATFKPDHGTAGFSVVFDDSKASQMSHALSAFPFIKRFPGLDYDYSVGWNAESNPYLGPKRGVADTRRTIRCTNWLSILDDGFLAELGGLEKVKEALGSNCPALPYEGGAVLQAGPEPQLGDLNYGVVPEHYRTVARLLKSLRFEDYSKPGLIRAPEPLDWVAETRAWITRFD
jgi:hypothetical protein